MFSADKRINSLSLYTIMIFLGLISGYFQLPVLTAAGLFIADIFIKIFKCISLPIIALSIIVTVANCISEPKWRSLWKRTLTYTFATTFIAALISAILYSLIKPASVGFVPAVSHHPFKNLSYSSYLANIIPSNFITPFLEHQVMSVLLLGIVVGIAIRFIPDEQARNTINQFFKGLHGLLMVITGWVITLIPLGIFGFITSTIAQFKTGTPAKGIGSYLAIIVLANLIQGFVVLTLWLRSEGIKPFVAFKNMLPALSVAFFSKSSVGTLPVTMDIAEQNLKIKPEVSRFVLPLCTSLNMNGCAAFIFTTVIYLMQNQGIPITLPLMGLWVVVATIAAIGNAGVPMGCFFLSASLLVSMNVPISLLGIILPFYTLIDMLETALNVWSDSCVTKIVDKKWSKGKNVIKDDKGQDQYSSFVAQNKDVTSLSVTQEGVS